MEENLVSASQSAEKMTVSVIIPVYNVAPYLDACLESVCSQTYDKLEIILVDDGSKDESSRLCDNWRERDPRIRVIHQENAGVSCARNKGLDVCTGELICFVDSDDWLDLRMIEKLVRCLQENDADAAMCGFVDYPHGAPVEKGLFPVPPCDFTGTVYQMIRRNGYFTALWAKLFRRALVFRGEGPVRFDPSLAFGEDEVWLLEVLCDAKRSAFVPEALYTWRPREGSVTRASVVTEKQLSIFRAKAQSLRLLPDNAALRALARGRIYNDCFQLKVQAYCSDNEAAFSIISQQLRPMWRDWLRSDNMVFLRKCKVLMMDAEMLLHLPKAIVHWTNELTH